MEQTARDKKTSNVIATKKQIGQFKYIPVQSCYALHGQHFESLASLKVFTHKLSCNAPRI